MSGDSVLALARGNNPIAGFMAALQQSNWDVVPLHFVFPGLAGKPVHFAVNLANRELGTFNRYLWAFVDGELIVNAPRCLKTCQRRRLYRAR